MLIGSYTLVYVRDTLGMRRARSKYAEAKFILDLSKMDRSATVTHDHL